MGESPKNILNAWRERGFEDGHAGRKARTPLNVPKDCTDAYLRGFNLGHKERSRGN